MAKLTVRELAIFSVLGALTFGAKYVMSFLPNMEPASLMVMLFAVVFGRKCLYPIYLYVGMEVLFYGIGLWNMNYLYIWVILAGVAYLFRKMHTPFGWALVSGIFGLLFGALCAVVDVPIGGFSYAVAKWVSGIPFDIMHCVSNFLIALLLFDPMRNLMEGLYRKTAK